MQRQAPTRTNQYTIAQVAKLLKVSTAMVRKWERLGIVTPERFSNGYRSFSEEEVSRLKQMQTLRKEKNLSSAAVIHLLGKGDVEPPDGSNGAKIGARLKRLRDQRQLTLSEAAEQTEVSISYLSSIERGHSNPSVAVLQRLSAFYGTNVLSFFGEINQNQKHIRPVDRQRITTNSGVVMELLASGQCIMEPHLFQVPAGASSGGTYSHDGEEFIYIIKGTFEIWLDDTEHYVMVAGDSLYFPSRQVHRWMNPGEETAEMIWCGSVPF